MSYRLINDWNNEMTSGQEGDQVVYFPIRHVGLSLTAMVTKQHKRTLALEWQHRR